MTCTFGLRPSYSPGKANLPRQSESLRSPLWAHVEQAESTSARTCRAHRRRCAQEATRESRLAGALPAGVSLRSKGSMVRSFGTSEPTLGCTFPVTPTRSSGRTARRLGTRHDLAGSRRTHVRRYPSTVVSIRSGHSNRRRRRSTSSTTSRVVRGRNSRRPNSTKGPPRNCGATPRHIPALLRLDPRPTEGIPGWVLRSQAGAVDRALVMVPT